VLCLPHSRTVRESGDRPGQAHGPCQKLSPSRVSRERVTQRLRVDRHCDAPEISLSIYLDDHVAPGRRISSSRGKADVADTPCPCQTGQASLRSSRVIPVQCMWNYRSEVQSIFHFLVIGKHYTCERGDLWPNWCSCNNCVICF
jgi:hypothetical protein